jgi:hypothetical protein
MQDPKILTSDLFKLYLPKDVITEFLRQVSDLDVPEGTDPKLDLKRDQLKLFIARVEEEILQKYTEPRVRVSPGRFDPFIPTIGAVHLIGYEEVTEEEVDTGTDLPQLPDGTDYELEDPNPITMDEKLLEALRETIARVAQHAVHLPADSLERKDQGTSREDYNERITRRPRFLYRALRNFDTRRTHHFL